MPRHQPHPLALFSLIPANPRAKAVLQLPENQNHISLVSGTTQGQQDEPVYGLDIGFNIASQSSHTLATLGRTADVVVAGSQIADIQCSFELHTNTEEVFLRDHSSNRSTQTYGKGAILFNPESPIRRVVIARGVNPTFGFGGTGNDLFCFRIHWHGQNFNIGAQLTFRLQPPPVLQRPARLPARPITRIRNNPAGKDGARESKKAIRYYKKDFLGRGSFGAVYKVVDVDTGNHLALKLIRWPDIQSASFVSLKREVEIQVRLSHPHIVKFISSQSGNGSFIEIFTELKEGNVAELAAMNVFKDNTSVAKLLLYQMLQALDYLAHNGIVHRDVKPANILYTSGPADAYTFELTDFGVSNKIAAANTIIGSMMYMAPELLYQTGPQTPKADVWSLFVTMGVVLKIPDFRANRMDGCGVNIRTVRGVANHADLKFLQPMADEDVGRRASAGEMLTKVFDGVGRTTP